jgi:acetyl-CoA synthetase
MVQLTDITGYKEAHHHFSKDALWDLFDGNRARLNIGHECVDRDESGRTAIRVARDDGTYELATFGELRETRFPPDLWVFGRETFPPTPTFKTL